MRAAFRQDGYVSQIPILSAGALRRAQAWVAELESRRDRGMLQPQEVNLHLRGERHAWELASHPRVINVARELLGVSDIFCMSTTLFTKYPSKRAGPKRVGWHQDVLHWNLHPPEVLNVWLALDDADEENGCMRVVPRSHTRGILPHRHDPADTNNVLMGYQDIDEQAVLGLGADGSPAVSLPPRSRRPSSTNHTHHTLYNTIHTALHQHYHLTHAGLILWDNGAPHHAR